MPRGAAAGIYIKGCRIGDLSLLLQTLDRQQLCFVFVKVFKRFSKRLVMATSKASRDYGSTDKDPVANLFRHHPAQFVGPDVVVSDWTDEYMKSNFYVPAFGPVGLSIDDDIVPFSKWSLFLSWLLG